MAPAARTWLRDRCRAPPAMLRPPRLGLLPARPRSPCPAPGEAPPAGAGNRERLRGGAGGGRRAPSWIASAPAEGPRGGRGCALARQGRRPGAGLCWGAGSEESPGRRKRGCAGELFPRSPWNGAKRGCAGGAGSGEPLERREAGLCWGAGSEEPLERRGAGPWLGRWFRGPRALGSPCRVPGGRPWPSRGSRWAGGLCSRCQLRLGGKQNSVVYKCGLVTCGGIMCRCVLSSVEL